MALWRAVLIAACASLSAGLQVDDERRSLVDRVLVQDGSGASVSTHQIQVPHESAAEHPEEKRMHEEMQIEEQSPDLKQIIPFDPNKDVVLVYSEGKTGTNTIQNGIGKMMQPPCLIVNGKNVHIAGAARRGLKCQHPECAKIFLRNRPQGSRTFMITSNRDPFTKAPSHLMQALGHLKQNELRNMSAMDFSKLFHHGGTLHGKTFSAKVKHRPWYTRNYLDLLGIDVTSHPFDFKSGYQRIVHVWEKRRLDIIILRLEDHDRWDDILRPFFPNVKTFVAANQATDKSGVISSKYKEFVSALSYTDEEIKIMSQKADFLHFYTHEEQKKFVKNARDSSLRVAAITSEDLSVEDDDSDRQDARARMC